MGTSSAFSGQSGGTPLIPSWLGDDGPVTDDAIPDVSAPEKPVTLPMPAIGEPTRFSVARNNFSRFTRSGGNDRRSLGRAISHYVRSSAGGSRTAAARMGSARRVGSRLIDFMSDVVARGTTEALRALNLENLAGRPIEEIFLGLSDYVCPNGGSIDEGIAREAFIETITDLAEAGITDLDRLTADQMQTVFELYATNAIEARLCNDIGARIITLPSDSREAAHVQAQLKDFIRRGVADALIGASIVDALTSGQVLQFVGDVYEQAFNILRIMGEAEEEAV
jgi:hypothetical protein